MLYIFILLFNFYLTTYSEVKLVEIPDEIAPLSFKDRAGKCEKTTVMPGVETAHKYLNYGKWNQIFNVRKDEVLRIELEDASNNVYKKNYFVIVSFNPLLGTKIWSFPFGDSKKSGMQYLFMNEKYRNYINNRFIIEEYKEYFDQGLSIMRDVVGYKAFRQEFMMQKDKFLSSNIGIDLKKGDVLEMLLLDSKQILKYMKLFNVEPGSIGSNGWVFPDLTAYNGLFTYQAFNFTYTNNKLSSSADKHNKIVDLLHQTSMKNDAIELDVSRFFDISNSYSFGKGLEIFSDQGEVFKKVEDSFYENKYLYHQVEKEGILGVQLLPDFYYINFLSTYMDVNFIDSLQASNLVHYSAGNYFLLVSVVTKQSPPILQFKIEDKDKESVFCVDEVSSEVSMPLDGILSVKVLNEEKMVGANSLSQDNDTVYVKITREVRHAFISGFMHDLAIMMIDFFQHFAKQIYIILSQDNLLRSIFQIIAVILLIICVLKQDIREGISLFIRTMVVLMIIFNLQSVNSFFMYMSDGVLEFVKFIFHGYFNVLTFQPFQIFDLVFLKLIAPFTIVFIGQIICSIFMLFVLSFIFSFFSQMLWGLIMQSFILPLEVYVSIINFYFLISFLPILIVFFLLFDFSKEVPMNFAKELVINIIIKITSLFVFALYLEFIITLLLSIFGHDLIVCYDSNGIPQANNGISYNIWSIIILYAFSLIIQPSINKMQGVLHRIFEG